MQTQTRSRKSLMRKACPRCGGDVCRMRDTFGVYHLCAQCGREFRRQPAVTIPPTTINAPANHTEKKEPLMV
ncbi:MAG: hypothetical protein OXE87_16930 [Chloroflexi bacterium]|nr:hypothetical protein [Chloroflexota bacterium]